MVHHNREAKFKVSMSAVGMYQLRVMCYTAAVWLQSVYKT